MINNKGSVLIETVISIAFISIVTITSFIMINVIVNRNSKLYGDQIERRTKNLLYSKLADDLYRYNISSYDKSSNTFHYYMKESDSDDKKPSKTLKIENGNLIYGNYTSKSNSSIYYNSFEVIKDTGNDMLTVTITYNDNQKLNFYSINYKGE